MSPNHKECSRVGRVFQHPNGEVLHSGSCRGQQRLSSWRNFLRMGSRIGTVAFLGGWISLAPVADALERECVRRVLPTKSVVSAPTAGTWLPEVQDLVMLDPYRREVVSAISGALVSKMSSSNDYGLPLRWPFLVRSGNSTSDLFVEVTGPKRIGNHYTYPDQIFKGSLSGNGLILDGPPVIRTDGEPFEDKQGTKYQLTEIYDWCRFADGFLAYSTFKYVSEDDHRSPSAGFIFLDEARNLSLIHEVKTHLELVHHYARVDQPYLGAVNETTALFFDFGDGALLKKIDLIEQGREKAFVVSSLDELVSPGAVKRPAAPSLPDAPSRYRGSREEFALLASYEQSPMLHSLYVRQGRAYVLSKSEMHRNELGEGSTEWQVLAVNASTGSVERRARVRSHAANLSLVPGSDFWAFYERSAVVPVGPERYAFSQADSILLMPAEWIEQDDAPAWDGDAESSCTTISGDSTQWLKSLLAGP